MYVSHLCDFGSAMVLCEEPMCGCVYGVGLLGFGLNEFPNACAQGCTYEGAYDEDPEVTQCAAALEYCGRETACGIDARTCVANASEVYQHEAEADGQTCKVVGGTVGLAGGAKHYEYEDAGEYDFGYKAANHADSVLEVVRSRTGEACIAGEQVEKGATDECTNDLEDDVHRSVFGTHAACEQTAQGDGWIDVTTRYAADGVGHGNY